MEDEWMNNKRDRFLIKCEKQSMINNMGAETEDETTTVAHVLKMKQVLDETSSHESVLLESLSKLQHMVKSVNVLKLTGVGISVNALRKHASKRVVDISTTLVKEWKRMVKEWMKDSENMQQQEGGELDANPKNPPQIEKQLTVPESDEKRSLVVRIKLKKVEPKGPVTPEQEVENDNNDGVARVFKESSLNSERQIEGADLEEPKKRMKEGHVEEKIEAIKRKVDKAYDEVDKMKMKKKKKRRIQVLDFDEVKKIGFGCAQIEKQLMVPESDKKRSLIVRIKYTKFEQNGPETPEQKVGNDKDDGVTRVLRIKEILDDVNVSESVVLESLMKLLEMSLSRKTLQETRIGRSVRKLVQKHGSKDVRQIAWGLANKWEGMMDEYIKKESSLKSERKVERVDLEEAKKRMKEGIEVKFNARKRMLEKAYEVAEKMKKKKRKIQVNIKRR